MYRNGFIKIKEYTNVGFFRLFLWMLLFFIENLDLCGGGLGMTYLKTVEESRFPQSY